MKTYNFSKGTVTINQPKELNKAELLKACEQFARKEIFPKGQGKKC